MKFKFLLLFVMLPAVTSFGQPEDLIYHEIQKDASGKIIPWFSPEPGTAYSHVVQSVWQFWDTMRIDMNGLPYYMNHQVWIPEADDPRGIGGDQIQMALSSWLLLYQYTGNERIKENMKFMADYYLSHGLSSSTAQWADIPYPYNTLIYSGIYDGDMVIGRNYTQPDKAGSLGLELIHLYKMTGTKRHGQTPGGIYLESAINIANTLGKHMIAGDASKSPLPFKVNAITGELGKLLSDKGDGSIVSLSEYTTNWSGTMELFLELMAMNKGEVTLYKHSFENLLAWMKNYPLKNNKWGPFFEDVPGWSDTQINAVTFARFIMNHREYFPDWKNEVEGIFRWVYKTLENKSWEKYGVVVINEQTAYMTPGNSHTSREGAAELQYVVLSGDTTRKQNAIRQLNWATYMVDYDGKNRYPQDENWLTDGYGDYVRHFLRAMDVMPELAPSDEDHILSSTSVIQEAEYKNKSWENYLMSPGNPDLKNIMLRYTACDNIGVEKIRLIKKPSTVLFDGKSINASENQAADNYSWKPMKNGGLLTVNRVNAREIVVME
jgi:hypothetical protein